MRTVWRVRRMDMFIVCSDFNWRGCRVALRGDHHRHRHHGDAGSPTTDLLPAASSATVRGCLPPASSHRVASAPGAASPSLPSCRWCRRRRWCKPGFRADLSISSHISDRQLLRWLDIAATGEVSRSSADYGSMPPCWNTSSASPPVGIRQSRISLSRRSGRCAAAWPLRSSGIALLSRMAGGRRPSAARNFVISNPRAPWVDEDPRCRLSVRCLELSSSRSGTRSPRPMPG
jgi:hypothetical protein